MIEDSAADGTGSAGNSDDATIQQIENIEKEVASAQPLIGPKETICVLITEYSDNDSATFLAKSKELANVYEEIRRVRGDGNCFYRALIFAQIEYMLTHKDEYEKFHSIAESWKPKLFKLGFPEFTTEDFCDTFMEYISRIGKNDLTIENVVDTFNDDSYSNYLVVFMRLVTSGYLQEREEFYSNFVDGQRTLKEYCAQEVEPMFKVCDHLCISALTQALGMSFRIEYLDRTEAPEGGWHHDFKPEDDTSVKPNLYFLYRHDHYDILYSKV